MAIETSQPVPCYSVRERITNPHDAFVKERRDDLLREAAARSPGFGVVILPFMLQPLQEYRYTAEQILSAFNQLANAPVCNPCCSG
jgi:hypothetical protein